MSKEKPKRLHLKNVRISFPSLFKKEVFEGKEGKYAATFLIPKSNKELKKLIDVDIQKALNSFKGKIASDKICLRDGDEIFEEKGYEGYEDHWVLKATNKKKPNVFNKNGDEVTEEDEVIYAGCYVYAIIDFWIQNNAYGKRLNANLYGVRFFKDGEPLGSGPIDVSDEFDEDEFSDDL